MNNINIFCWLPQNLYFFLIHASGNCDILYPPPPPHHTYIYYIRTIPVWDGSECPSSPFTYVNHHELFIKPRTIILVKPFRDPFNFLVNERRHSGVTAAVLQTGCTFKTYVIHVMFKKTKAHVPQFNWSGRFRELAITARRQRQSVSALVQ